MLVSIVIINWNTRDILHDCLKSVYEQTKDIAFEVIVVDNASEDGSQEMVRQQFPEVILIANQQNRGFAAANNQGMKIAKGKYILLLNSDTIVLDNAIGRSIQYAEKHPRAAVVGCKILNQDHTLQPSCFMFPSLLNMFLFFTYLYKIFPQSRFFGRERMTWWQRDDHRQVDVVTGCFMLVRKTAIEKVGMFDERYFIYGEETDWCKRFQKAGLECLFYPDAQIIHLGGASSAKRKGPMTLQLTGSILQFFAKHRSRPAYILACIMTSLFFALRLPYWMLKVIIDNKNRQSNRQTLSTYARGTIQALNGWQGLVIKKPKE